MLIREATAADIPQIIALAQRSETAAQWNARQYEDLFAPDAPKRVALVAAEQTSAGGIAGFAVVHCVGEEWELENIVVDPDCRRQGIGQQIMRELLLRARRAQAAAILLEVRESNTAALQLYRKIGFSETGRRRAYYSSPSEDALLLRLELQPRDKIP